MTEKSSPHPFGIDFGGSGIKGAPVDLDTGEFGADRTRVETPKGGKPQDVADVVAELVTRGAGDGAPIGITVPGVVVHGVVKSAANIDESWIYTDAVTMFRDKLHREVVVVNDADAAGLAEVRYGAARDQDGLVIVTTLGTGIGTRPGVRRRAGARTPSWGTSRSTARTPRPSRPTACGRRRT